MAITKILNTIGGKKIKFSDSMLLIRQKKLNFRGFSNLGSIRNAHKKITGMYLQNMSNVLVVFTHEISELV